MRASLFKYKGKKYVAIRNGEGKKKGMVLFQRVRRQFFLFGCYVPTKDPAFWLDRNQYQKTPDKVYKKRKQGKV